MYKIPSLLQRIARERTWIIYFQCKDIHLPHYRSTYIGNLSLSDETLRLKQEVNEKMKELRESIDKDWQNQRAKIKERIKS